MIKACTALLLLVMASCTGPKTTDAPTAAAAAQTQAEISRIMDDWHDAASKADEHRYFSHFSNEAVFLGTDASERWDMPAFRSYAHPIFSKGKGWSFHAVRR